MSAPQVLDSFGYHRLAMFDVDGRPLYRVIRRIWGKREMSVWSGISRDMANEQFAAFTRAERIQAEAMRGGVA